MASTSNVFHVVGAKPAAQYASTVVDGLSVEYKDDGVSSSPLYNTTRLKSDLSGSGGGGAPLTFANKAARLVTSGTSAGQRGYQASTGMWYTWNGSAWIMDNQIGVVGNVPAGTEGDAGVVVYVNNPAIQKFYEWITGSFVQVTL